jgi:alkanesulfonate monooxygenase SsuD/methylene tetrahydromethanopterin reductase-like flavin-dependent oxidoreductase (luciferase family)
VTPMGLRIFTNRSRGSYDQLLAVAKASERLGFEAFFRSDHYLAMGGAGHGRSWAAGGAGLPGPTGAGVTLGALTRETSRIRLGTLLSSATVLGRRPSRRTGPRPIQLHPPTAHLVRRVATAHCALGP